VRVKAAVAAHEAADAATDRRVDTTFDKFHDRYSTRSLGLKTSPVRALFAVANRPEVVSLAGGMPKIAELPLDVVRICDEPLNGHHLADVLAHLRFTLP